MVKAIMHGCNGHMGRVITDMTIRYLKASMHVTWRPM